jgi:hypothetical protein
METAFEVHHFTKEIKSLGIDFFIFRSLENRLKTEINFNFHDQCFEITGRSQQACDET